MKAVNHRCGAWLQSDFGGQRYVRHTARQVTIVCGTHCDSRAPLHGRQRTESKRTEDGMERQRQGKRSNINSAVLLPCQNGDAYSDVRRTMHEESRSEQPC